MDVYILQMHLVNVSDDGGGRVGLAVLGFGAELDPNGDFVAVSFDLLAQKLELRNVIF